MRYKTFLFSASLVFAGCSGGNVNITGKLVGLDNRGVVLEMVMPGGTSMADSVRTDQKGAFSISADLPEGESTIYNIRCGNGVIPLIVSPGEKIKISSVGDLSRNYTVDGSPESSRMRELKMIMEDGARTLDSILSTLRDLPESERKKVINAYTAEYYKIKRDQIRFIVTEPGSLSSLFALYQRLPGDTDLFNGEGDIIYYRIVADSVEVNHPNSPYLKALRRHIAAVDNGRKLADMITARMGEEPVGYPDIELADMYGKKHRLSSMEGKVILLDFWAAASPEARFVNAEYRELYKKYADYGFNIYQVSVDESRALWVTSVQEQKLPWTTVTDPEGFDGVAPRTYNVTGVPANFLIDRNGDIVSRNIYGEELRRKVENLIK